VREESKRRRRRRRWDGGGRRKLCLLEWRKAYEGDKKKWACLLWDVYI